jgi:hypothetical protein
MPSKKKTTKAAKPAPEPAVEAPPDYIVAKCAWCGMQWKHYDDSPPHYCGKVCASHAPVDEDPAE